MPGEIWSSMADVSDKLLLDKAQPNTSLVEEALSFNAAELHKFSDERLRQYLVVLGQYLITLQYEENKTEAVYAAWSRTLDSHVFKVLSSKSPEMEGRKKLTLTERKAWVIENDPHASQLDAELQVAESKKRILNNMHKPVEQYINTLKKEVDARENDKRRSGVR